MGMFDTIVCEHPLPDACPAREFQTQSLSCVLDAFRLTAAGRLIDGRGNDTSIHGVLRMVASDRAERGWEYEAKFSDGQLMHLLPKAQAHYDEDGLAAGRQRRCRSAAQDAGAAANRPRPCAALADDTGTRIAGRRTGIPLTDFVSQEAP